MAPQRVLRIYADTSVFGGCFDEEFDEPSNRFFEMVRSGGCRLVLSSATIAELRTAPDPVRNLLRGLPPEALERVPRTLEIRRLRDAYIEARVVGPSSLIDAEHIATATVANVDLVVSWNFKHIVHYSKIGAYNGVNLLCGYRELRIHSPLEVVSW